MKLNLFTNKHDLLFYLLIQYEISQSDVASYILWLRMWDSNQMKFLGEVNLLLAKSDLTDPTAPWHSLQERVSIYSLS